MILLHPLRERFSIRRRAIAKIVQVYTVAPAQHSRLLLEGCSRDDALQCREHFLQFVRVHLFYFWYFVVDVHRIPCLWRVETLRADVTQNFAIITEWLYCLAEETPYFF